MGVSKTFLFTRAQNEIASIAKVLSHPARVAIVQLASESEKCIQQEMAEKLGLSPATIQQHVKVLKDSGLLKGKFVGRSYQFCLNVEKFERFQNNINTYFDTTKQNCC